MILAGDDIQRAASLVRDLCGVVLDESKGYLIKSRLSKIFDDVGCETVTEFCRKASYDKKLSTKITDAITTHETSFFRDHAPYEAIKNHLVPVLMDSKAGTAFPKRLRLWSAACSTGQEPYSIAMALAEILPVTEDWDVHILATDISASSIETASTGFFQSHEIQRGLKPGHLTEHFEQINGGYKVKDEIRGMVSFRRLNLLESFAGIGTFDIVLCRNAAIYFEQEVKNDLFRRITQTIAPEGYLFLGAAEMLTDEVPKLMRENRCGAIFYRKNC